MNTLTDLVQFNKPLSLLSNELSQFEWDYNSEELTISKSDIIKVLQRCILANISISEIEEWANLIECREDIKYEDNTLQNIIFQLANPLLEGKISQITCKQLLDKLMSKKS